ncbi:tail fiber domain-containing protein [Chloroflexi bacterium TSY]|nr:tail fiber domain-containing protein [Chloroflexi bacterium TSY]
MGATDDVIWVGDGIGADGLQSLVLRSGDNNRVFILADGNVGIGKPDPGHPLHMASGAHVTVGGSWENASDRNLKENFEPIDEQEILAKLVELPVTRWNYKTEDDSIRRIGPMAQDFHEAFGLGTDDKHIGTVDATGIALAAIQALAAENAALQKHIDSISRSKFQV